MVDLVKIRKKAKEKKEEAAAASARSKSSAPEPEKRPEAKPRPAAKAKGTKRVEARPSKREIKGDKPIVEAGRKGPATMAEGPEAPPSLEGGRDASPAATDRLEQFKDSAGARRVGPSAAGVAAAVEPSAAQMELLSFTLAGEQYAIEIERIAEIIAPRPTTPVPNAPSPVVGIISLRGTIVTMLDLRRQLGHASEFPVGPETRTIVVEDGGGMAGFVVDRVLRVVKIDPAQIQNHPIVSPSEQTEAIRGVIQQGNALTIVLDVERLLS